MRALSNGTFKKVSSSVRSRPTTKPKSIPRRLLLLVVFALPPCMVDPRYTSAYPAGTSSLIASLNVFKTSGRLNIRVLTAFRSSMVASFFNPLFRSGAFKDQRLPNKHRTHNQEQRHRCYGVAQEPLSPRRRDPI